MSTGAAVFPTVREVLALPVVQQGGPEVVAAGSALDRPVRWVHVGEIPDLAEVLRGGELVLTTGIGLPADDAGLARWFDTLADVDVAGVFIELGRRFTGRLPVALVDRARRRGVPLVELRRQLRFVAVTEAVHSRVIDAQLAELRASEQIHQTFTELSVEGAEPQQVLHEVARLSGCAVVLENLAHQVLAYEAGPLAPAVLLDRWEARSRAVPSPERTHHDEATGWLVTAVEARGHDWGRLVLLGEGSVPAQRRTLLERAASTIALNRLVLLDRESLERQVHRNLLAGLLTHSSPTRDVALRAGALGVPLDGRRLLGVVVRPRGPRAHPALAAQARVRDVAEAVAESLKTSRVQGLTGALDETFGAQAVGVLVSLATADRDGDVLTRLTDALGVHDRGLIVAAGSVVASLDSVRRSFIEAAQVADAALHTGEVRPFYRLPDVRLRGLLHLLRDDARLQTFVERELGPLLGYDQRHGTAHVDLLTAYLAGGRNKSHAAQAAGLSRSALYERLQLIGRILETDLDSAESCLSLHVALLALQALRSGGTAPVG
jgi:purine catabolism regulator